MAFNISARVEVILKNGQKAESYCKLPAGFSDDDERDTVIRNKFMRETLPVWGEQKAIKVEKIIMNLDQLRSNDLMTAIRGSTS